MIAAILLAATVSAPFGDQKTFIYGTETPIVACSPDVACDIVFSRDDEIQDIVTPDSKKRHADGWTIARGLQGELPALYVTPNKRVGETNLVVTTSKRTYHITLLAIPVTRVTSYRFLVPDKDGVIAIQATPAPRIVLQTPTPDATADPIPPAPSHMKFIGDPTLMPAKAERLNDRIELTFKVPNGSTLPGVGHVDTNGNIVSANVSRRVRVQPDGEIVTIDIYDFDSPIAIYDGEGSAQHRLILQP